MLLVLYSLYALYFVNLIFVCNVVFSTIQDSGQLENTIPPPMPLLEEFNLSNNDIRVLAPFAFAKCPLLIRLDVSHNQLRSLGGLEESCQLQELNANHNQLRLVSGIGQLNALTWLDLGHNQISTLVALRYVG